MPAATTMLCTLVAALQVAGGAAGVPFPDGRWTRSLRPAPGLGLVCRRRLLLARAHLPYLASYGLVLAVFNVLWTFSVAG